MEYKVKLGQQWYFFAQSKTYIVYKIEHKRHQYYDGEVLKEDTTIYLRSQGNVTITRRPEDFNENTCKLVLGSKTADVPEDTEIIPVQIKSRLEKVDE